MAHAIAFPEKFHVAHEYMEANHPIETDTSLSDETRLALYAFQQQATVGACKESGPSFWQTKKYVKHSAWKELGNLSRLEAMVLYVQMVEKAVDQNWFDKVKLPQEEEETSQPQQQTPPAPEPTPSVPSSVNQQQQQQQQQPTTATTNPGGPNNKPNTPPPSKLSPPAALRPKPGPPRVQRISPQQQSYPIIPAADIATIDDAMHAFAKMHIPQEQEAAMNAALIVIHEASIRMQTLDQEVNRLHAQNQQLQSMLSQSYTQYQFGQQQPTTTTDSPPHTAATEGPPAAIDTSCWNEPSTTLLDTTHPSSPPMPHHPATNKAPPQQPPPSYTHPHHTASSPTMTQNRPPPLPLPPVSASSGGGPPASPSSSSSAGYTRVYYGASEKKEAGGFWKWFFRPAGAIAAPSTPPGSNASVM